jgi:hypothetical protein
MDKPVIKMVRARWSRLGTLVLLILEFGNIGLVAQTPNRLSPAAASDTSQRLIEKMAGVWDVTQRMWGGPGAAATNLPSAVARRRLLGGAILEEQMDLAPGQKGEAFTRVAFFNRNAVTRQYEYFSIDSRAPQMMLERSYDSETRSSIGETINLLGSMFVAPKWGDAANAAFRYRLVVGPVLQDRQTVRLYLTPVSDDSAREFLAFEYVYTRHP